MSRLVQRVRALLGVVMTLAPLACGGAAPLPPAALAQNAAGAAALQAGDLETATARLELALEYNPEFVEALSNLGLVELARGNFARTRQLLERAVRLNPEVVQPQHGLGLLAEREHRPDVASRHYRQALSLDPGFAASRANLARLLLQGARVEDALLEYRKLRQVDPNSVAGAAGYVECLLLLSRTGEASAELGRAQERFGHTAPLLLLQARLWIHNGRLDEARRALTPLTRTRDDFALEANAWLAVVDLARGEPERALEAVRRALRLNVDHPLTLFVAAVCLDQLDDPGSLAWLERAMRANPGNRELLRRLEARRTAHPNATN